jgi:hypothetical protein
MDKETHASWNPKHLQKISIKYVNNSMDFFVLMASLHAFAPVPHLVVIDELYSMIDPQAVFARQDITSVDKINKAVHFLDDAICSLKQELDFETMPRLRLVISESSGNAMYFQMLRSVLPDVYLHVRDQGTCSLHWTHWTPSCSTSNKSNSTDKENEPSLFANVEMCPDKILVHL